MSSRTPPYLVAARPARSASNPHRGGLPTSAPLVSPVCRCERVGRTHAATGIVEAFDAVEDVGAGIGQRICSRFGDLHRILFACLTPSPA